MFSMNIKQVTRGAVLAWLSTLALAHEPLQVWPTIPFVRGQDLCQYQDAYGRSRSAQVKEMSEGITEFLRAGAKAADAAHLMTAVDTLVDKNRQLASVPGGMDITLGGNLKAEVDRLYREIRPQRQMLSFSHASGLNEVLANVRRPGQEGPLTREQLTRLNGLIWGTYSYAPRCAGDLLVTVHVELKSGKSYSFNSGGRLEVVVADLAHQLLREFQSTQFPTTVTMGNRRLTLLGTPGGVVCTAPSAVEAERACKAMNARLPTPEEYDYLNILGDWNGGITLGREMWALAGNLIFAPDLRNPSPVRTPQEVQCRELKFICVR